jgi:hypothetical protein
MRHAFLPLIASAAVACFADPPPGGGDDDSSGSPTSAETGGTTGGPDTQPTATSASMTAPGTETTDDAETTSTDDTASSESEGEGESGGAPRFCDMPPAGVDICRDFDGDDPFAGWGVNESHGEVTSTTDDPVSPPNALVTTTTPDLGGEVSTAMVGAWTGGLPTPVTSALVRVRVWFGADCFDSPSTRSTIQFAWIDEDAPPAAPYAFNLTIWFAADRIMVAECDEPEGYPSIEHEVQTSVAAEQWLDIAVDVELAANAVSVIIDDTPFPVALEQTGSTLLGALADIPLSYAIGQSTPSLTPCTMRFDDYTLDLR